MSIEESNVSSITECRELSCGYQSYTPEFPPPLNYIEMALCFIYGAVFILGMLGNLYFISVIIRILAFTRNGFTSKHLLVFLFGLSMVDMLVLIFLPFVITELTKRSWDFGPILCKLHLGCEVSSKLMSTMLLTALSADRYISVCHPMSRMKFRTTKGAVTAVLCLAVLGVLLLILVSVYATVKALDVKMPLLELINGTTRQNFVIHTVAQCSFNAPESVLVAFVHVMFVLGFCVPGVMIGCFYALMVRRLYIQERRFKSIPVWKVTRSILLVVVFYYLCWSPYWLIAVIAKEHLPFKHERWFIFLSVFIHCLPYVNSCINPILYCYLNKEIRRNFAAIRADSSKTVQPSFSEILSQRIGMAVAKNSSSPCHKLSLERNIQSAECRLQSAQCNGNKDALNKKSPKNSVDSELAGVEANDEVWL